MSIKKRFTVVLMSLALSLVTLCGVVSVSQIDVHAASPLETLKKSLKKGTTNSANTKGTQLDYSKNTYDKEGGGYYIYTDITSADSVDRTIISEQKLGELTAGGKRKFLTDLIRIGNQEVANNKLVTRSKNNANSYISEETMNEFMQELQGVPGAGSQLLATLMAETKPDYVTANRIYKPFSGTIGTILGFLSILIMALLGVTMGLDIAYITIPAFQLFLDGDSDGGNGQGAKGMAKIISQEARNAVKAASDGGGSGQQGSSNKLAISVYFKHRWKGLVVLGICLLYLVQGEIYSFVAWVIDLVSGFVGF